MFVIGYIVGGIDMLSGYKFINVSKINFVFGEIEWCLIGFGFWILEGVYIVVILGFFVILFVFFRFGMKIIILIEMLILIVIIFIGS